MAEYENRTASELRFTLARHEYVVPPGKTVVVPDHLVYAVESMQIGLTRTDVPARSETVQAEVRETVVRPVAPKPKPKLKAGAVAHSRVVDDSDD